MKVNIEVDCTPDEARQFLGLPDVVPMQRAVMDAMERRLVEAISTTEPQKLMEQWLPLGVKGMEQWGALWTQVVQSAAGFPRPGGKKKD